MTGGTPNPSATTAATNRRIFRDRRWPAAIVLAAVVAYAVFFSWFTIIRYQNYNSGWYDLGIMSQTVWNVGHGHGFVFTDPERGPGNAFGQQVLRTSLHTDYLLFLLAPLSWTNHTPEALLALQSLVLAAGGWFVFLIGRRVLNRPWLACFLALVYLFYPALHYANIFDFHAVVLAVTFCLAGAEAILSGRRRMFWVWTALALLTKEQVGLTYGLMAWYLWWKTGQHRRAWWALGVAWGWMALQFLAVIPLSRRGLDAHFALKKFYSQGGFGPVMVLHRLLAKVHLTTVGIMAIPLGGILALASPLFLIAIPEILIYWVSDNPNLQTPYLHYYALAIPFLFLSTIFGIRRWLELIDHWRPTWRRGAMVGIVGVLLLGSAWGSWRNGIWPWSPTTRWPVVTWKEKQAADIATMLSIVPAGAPVAATQNLGAQLSQRSVFQLLPTDISHVDYVAIVRRSFGPNRDPEDKRVVEDAMIDQLIPWMTSTGSYRLLFERGRVLLYQRIRPVTISEPVWSSGMFRD